MRKAGNVVHKEMTWRLSFRLPPTLSGEKAEQMLKDKILEDKGDTYGAIVEFKVQSTGNGFDAPKLPEDL